MGREMSSSLNMWECCVQSMDCVTRAQKIVDQWTSLYHMVEFFNEWFELGDELTGNSQTDEWSRENMMEEKLPAMEQAWKRSYFSKGIGTHRETPKMSDLHQSDKEFAPQGKKQIVDDIDTTINPLEEFKTYRQHQQKTQKLLDKLQAYGSEEKATIKDFSLDYVGKGQSRSYYDSDNKDGLIPESLDPSSAKPMEIRKPILTSLDEMESKINVPLEALGRGQHFHKTFKGFQNLAQSINHPSFSNREASDFAIGTQSTGADQQLLIEDRSVVENRETSDFAYDNQSANTNYQPVIEDRSGVKNRVHHSMDQMSTIAQFSRLINQQQSVKRTEIDKGNNHSDNNQIFHDKEGASKAFQYQTEVNSFDTFDINDVWEAMTSRLLQDYKRHYGD